MGVVTRFEWRLIALLSVLPVLIVPLCARAQGVVEAWVQRYSNPAGSSDSAYRIALDPAGNVVVAGYTDGSISSSDALVLKYSSAGEVLWSARYDGPHHSHDEAYALGVDAAGNIFVAGRTVNGTQVDLLLLAYSSAGSLLWTNHHDGPWHLTDFATSLAVDPDGNIIVAGVSKTPSSYDFLVLKYSNTGQALWTNNYHAGNGVTALALDAVGNIFVSGSSGGDYATLAYSPAGIPLWTNRFNGTGNANDDPAAIAVDRDGNVFVTGSSVGVGFPYPDYATVAYSAAGLPLWTNRYDGPDHFDDNPAAIAVDGAGNVFVTGSAGPCTTIAYSGSGVPLWTNRFDGSDVVFAIAVDHNSTVLVTGYSYAGAQSQGADYATVAYSLTGVPLWTNRYDGPTSRNDQALALAVDDQGNVFVTGISDGIGWDVATVAYMNNGSGLWTNRFNWPGNKLDIARAVAVDDAGTIYVTGSSEATASADFATIAYSSLGMPLWTNRYTGSGDYSDEPNAIAVHRGRVFVTGYARQSDLSLDFATIAYSTSGMPLWTNRYNGPANGDDKAVALAVHTNGNVYVTGSSVVDIATANSDYLTIAYTADGFPLWTNTYALSSFSAEVAYAIAVDGVGNVFVTGYSTGVGTFRDYATVAYSASGLPLWTNRYNGPGARGDEAYAIAVDPDGNVIVTGTSDRNLNDYDYATIKYSNAGVPLWTNRYHIGQFDAAKAVAVGADGKVFVTGNQGSSTDDYGTIAYSPDGFQLWVRTFSQALNSQDVASSVALDSRGNVFVTGYSYAGTNGDIVTVAYSNSGFPLWTNRYDGPAHGSDSASSLAIAPDGSVIVVGSSDGSYTPNLDVHDFVTIKYETAPRLTATRANPNVELSWASAFTGWQLQARTNLLNGNWASVPGSTSTNRVSAPATNSSTYFRLHSPE